MKISAMAWRNVLAALSLRGFQPMWSHAGIPLTSDSGSIIGTARNLLQSYEDHHRNPEETRQDPHTFENSWRESVIRSLTALEGETYFKQLETYAELFDQDQMWDGLPFTSWNQLLSLRAGLIQAPFPLAPARIPEGKLAQLDNRIQKELGKRMDFHDQLEQLAQGQKEDEWDQHLLAGSEFNASIVDWIYEAYINVRIRRIKVFVQGLLDPEELNALHKWAGYQAYLMYMTG